MTETGAGSKVQVKWQVMISAWVLALAISPMFAAGAGAAGPEHPEDPGQCCTSTPGCNTWTDPEDGATVCRAEPGRLASYAPPPERQCRQGFYRCLRQRKAPERVAASATPWTPAETLASR